MAAPSVLILYSKDAYKEKEIANTIRNLLIAKYKEFTIMRYWSPFDPLADKEKRSEALAQVRHYVLLLSHAFITAYDQNPEWQNFLTIDPEGERGIIIPIYLEQCDCSRFLPAKSFLNFTGVSNNGTLNGQMSQELYRAFEDAKKKLEDYNNHAAFMVSGRTTTLRFSSEPPFPADAFFINLPKRNDFFSGQEQLTKIEQRFLRAQNAKRLDPYKLILSGFPGSGKTQIALEYAYTFFTQTYKYVFWIGSSDSTSAKQTLSEKIQPILKQLREKQMLRDGGSDVDAFQEWLKINSDWLLIFDDIDDVSLVDAYIPRIGFGHVLVTTCTRIVGSVDLLLIDKMSEETAIFFLIKQARIGDYQTFNEIPPNERMNARKIVQAMHLFALAIDHVGTFIASTGSSLEWFVTNYLENEGIPLFELLRISRPDGFYTLTLIESWQKHFEHFRASYPLAADLLIFCALFAPEGAYTKIITNGRSYLGSHLVTMTDIISSPSSLIGLIQQLHRFSFIETASLASQVLVVRPILPFVLHDLLTQQEQLDWAGRSIQAVAHTLRTYGTVVLEQEEKLRWQEQFKACERLIAEWNLPFSLPEITSLPDDIQLILEYKDKWMPKKEGEKGEQPGT